MSENSRDQLTAKLKKLQLKYRKSTGREAYAIGNKIRKIEKELNK